MSSKSICSICNQPIKPQANGYTGGHNADPITNGRCCDSCNALRVMPARIQQWLNKKAENEPDRR